MPAGTETMVACCKENPATVVAQPGAVQPNVCAVTP
jgi:hypothetical protein